MTRCGHGVMTSRTPATDDMCDHQFVSLLCEKCADPAILDFHCAEKKLKLNFDGGPYLDSTFENSFLLLILLSPATKSAVKRSQLVMT